VTVAGCRRRADARPGGWSRVDGVEKKKEREGEFQRSLGFSFLFSQKLDQPHFCSVHLPP